MEQLAARRAHNPKVIGSSPVPAIAYRRGYILRCSLFSISELYNLSSYLVYLREVDEGVDKMLQADELKIAAAPYQDKLIEIGRSL